MLCVGCVLVLCSVDKTLCDFGVVCLFGSECFFCFYQEESKSASLLCVFQFVCGCECLQRLNSVQVSAVSFFVRLCCFCCLAKTRLCRIFYGVLFGERMFFAYSQGQNSVRFTPVCFSVSCGCTRTKLCPILCGVFFGESSILAGLQRQNSVQFSVVWLLVKVWP